jgi:SAM-dependent methyltransferase
MPDREDWIIGKDADILGCAVFWFDDRYREVVVQCYVDISPRTLAKAWAAGENPNGRTEPDAVLRLLDIPGWGVHVFPSLEDKPVYPAKLFLSSLDVRAAAEYLCVSRVKLLRSVARCYGHNKNWGRQLIADLANQFGPGMSSRGDHAFETLTRCINW